MGGSMGTDKGRWPLKKDSAWTEAQMQHTAERQKELFEEIKGRIKQNDSSVPARKGDWYYYSRTVDGKQYPIHCRRAAGPEGPSGYVRLGMLASDQ